MTIRNTLLTLAVATLIAPAAFASAKATKDDCSSAQKQADAAVMANPHASAKSKELRAEAEKLCTSGKSADGVKKYEAAAKEARIK